MNRQLIASISLRLVLAWVALSIIGFVFAKQIASAFLPFFTVIIDKLSADYSAVLNIISRDNSPHIELVAHVVRPIALGGDKYIPPGTSLTSGSHVIHAMVPLVILFTVLIAWPAKHTKERVILLMLGLPVAHVVLGLITPQLLAGQIALKIFEYKLQEGEVVTEPFLIHWMIFVESGGRWLLPLAGAGVCAALTRVISQWAADFAAAGRQVNAETPKLSKQERRRKKKAKKRSAAPIP